MEPKQVLLLELLIFYKSGTGDIIFNLSIYFSLSLSLYTYFSLSFQSLKKIK